MADQDQNQLEEPSICEIGFSSLNLLSDGTKVSEVDGIIYGVSVITQGVKAKGHNLHVDITTLTQMSSCAKKRGKVPVKLNHKSGVDSVCGYLTNFRTVGQKLKADWHLLKTHDKFHHVIELATRMPESIGLSASFFGKPEKKAKNKFARCSDLRSVDLVADPAANPDGMFSSGDSGSEENVDTGSKGMANESANNDNTAPSNADVMTALSTLGAQLNGRMDDQDARIEDLTNFSNYIAENGLTEFEGDDGQGDDLDAENVTQFTDGQGSALDQLESLILGKLEAAEAAEAEQQFNALHERINQLVELCEQLGAENAAMATIMTDLEIGDIEVTPGDDGGEVSFSTPESRQNANGEEMTEFEARVDQLKEDGKSGAEAVQFAIKEDNTRYQSHLEAKGAIA